MTDVFQLLPKLQWRGALYPVTDRNVSFLHENVDHRIQYRENDFPEPIGPHSFLFKYTIPMREDLAKGPYKNLFNEGLLVLVRDMRNKEPGDLIDPVCGPFRCVPVSFSETTDINKRDGTDVQIEFLHSPRINDSDPVLPKSVTGIVGLVGESGLLDGELKLQDWNQQPSPEGSTNAIAAINGVIRQGLRQVDKIASGLDALSLEMQKIEDSVDVAENPQNWRIRDSARQTRLDIVEAKRRLSENPNTKLRRLTTKSNTTVSSLAKEVGMTVQELLTVNPSLSKSPRVAAGIKINVQSSPDRSRHK